MKRDQKIKSLIESRKKQREFEHHRLQILEYISIEIAVLLIANIKEHFV